MERCLLKNDVRDITVKRINQLPSGSILMECHNAEQQQKIKQVLSTDKNLILKETEKADPMVMITGIEKGYKEDEFIQELIEQNQDCKIEFGEHVAEEIKFVTKKQCRNNRKENWVLQIKPKVFKWFIKNEYISFDLMKLYVQEQLLVCHCCGCLACYDFLYRSILLVVIFLLN